MRKIKTNRRGRVSRKGQMLGFVAVFVLLGIMFFIFKSHQDTFDFTISAGSTQAHLVTSFVETEKAKVYAQNSLRQSAMEALWDLSKDQCDFQKACDDTAAFTAATKAEFDNYTAMYAASSDLITTLYPDYSLDTSCVSGRLKIEAYGFNEECLLRDGYPFPQLPCEDQDTQEKCSAVAYVDGRSGACSWDSTALECSEVSPAPICETFVSEIECTVETDCRWSVSFAEQIDVISAPLSNYQFRTSSNAHFIEAISCVEYGKFAESRVKLG